MKQKSSQSDWLVSVPEVEAKIHTSVAQLSREEDKSNEYSSRQNDIAIIGMACRFPQAPDLTAFWELLHEGKDAISEIPIDRWDWRDYYDENPDAENKTYSRWGGFINNIDKFDPFFFNISPREARLMDPQQRLFLEIAWETIEHAGYTATSLAQTEVGVFVGCSNNGYQQRIAPILTSLDHVAGIGNQNAIIANRISFFFNFRGPSVLVDTMCSSSLVSLHMACQSLRQGECEVALAGGVNILLSPDYYVGMSRMKAHSPDGRCKTFDCRANGVVLGEGAGALLLKPLSKAIEEGDTIYSLIKGSAVNHDGQTNGITAPNPRTQARVICQALKVADISADSLSYVEAHGTGTSLGDPIEIEGLTKAFRKYTDRKQFCAIGSVKTNIGHLESAAGIAGLIKIILSMQHRQLPPSLHFEKPNPFISFEKTPFVVNTKLSLWKSEGPRRAAISSFGMGGTNAHVILEEAPKFQPTGNDIEPSFHLLTLSAKSEKTLRVLTNLYASFLSAHPGISLANVCFTSNTGRTKFSHRLAVIAESLSQAGDKLAAFTAGKRLPKIQKGQVENGHLSKIVFLFTGQGSQYVGMGRQLYETQPTFRKILEQCDKLLRSELEQSLLSVLYPTSNTTTWLNETVYTQSALFALEYAIAQLWISWGVVPDAVMGHSVGEYVAACIAGVFSLEDGLKLVAARGRLMQALPKQGAMAVVFADQATVKAAIASEIKEVSIAAINSPENIVISGVKETVERICQQFNTKGIQTQTLKVSHAFHSPLMQPMLSAFEQTAATVEYNEPQIELISNLTGQVVSQEITSEKYWCRHIQEPVKFADGMQTLCEQNYQLFLEIGPNPILLGMGRRCRPDDNSRTWLPSLRKGKDDWQQMLDSLGSLYVSGVEVDWSQFYRDYSYRKVALPTYPFERARYWIRELPQQKSDSMTLWKSISQAGRQQSEHLNLDLKNDLEQLQYLNSLSSAYVINAIRELGAFGSSKDKYTVDQLINQFQILPRYRQLLLRWLEILVKENKLHKDGENFVNLHSGSADSVNANLAKIRTITTIIPDLTEVLRRCGENLVAVLTGKIEPTELIFPNGSIETVISLYKDSPLAKYYNNIVKTILQVVVKTLSPEKQLRILEVGAGTGGTTHWLLPVLPPERTNYIYTDLSSFFTIQARQMFKAYPFVQYQTLDIEQNPQLQGYKSHNFDIIIAANVLHATSHLEKALKHIYSLLAPNGLLILWEVTKPQNWFELIFGLLIPPLENDKLRQYQPLLSPQQWHKVLKASNVFANSLSFPDESSAAAVLGQNIIVAQGLPSLAKISSQKVSASIMHPLIGHRLY